jgi:hypothetical protein
LIHVKAQGRLVSGLLFQFQLTAEVFVRRICGA